MRDKCIVCDKEFTTEELLKKHEEKHLNESILNTPKENPTEIDISFQNKNIGIDIKKIFSEEKFEKLIEFKMNDVSDVQEIVTRRNFIEQIKKINQRNPFCYPGYFVRDFIAGFTQTTLQEKYHIWFWMDLHSIIHNILKFSENRYISQKYDNAQELNLKILDWNKKYQEFQNNCKFFEKEINELFFDNVLQTEIIFLLMDNELGSEDLFASCKELKNHYDLFHFVDGDLANSFNKILEIDLEERIEDILSGLKRENIIIRSRSNPKKLTVKFSIDEIKNNMINKLKIYGKMDYSTLRNLITNKFPVLRLIPKFGVFETSWKELDKEKKIHIEWKSRRDDDFIIFLNEDYQKIDIDIKSIEENQITIPFRGRKITPERFVDELLELDKGDFNDADDQVTRLAGLVLAESIKIQSPHEKIKEFDFTIDLKNYKFRPEQLDAISKLNFKINSEIMHVKVMINEVLNLKKYNELREKLPDNEQGVVITFKKIPLVVKKILEHDPTLQIVDEEGVKIWVSITTRIPARVNSISKIYVDPLSKLENKIVRVNSVFYETGIALVSIIPEMKEATVLARSLEEISFNEDSLNNYNVLSKNYFNFLKTLSIVAPDTFEDGLNIPIKSIEKKRVKNYQNGRMELIHDAWIVEYDHVKVEVDLNQFKAHSIFKCSCYHMVNQEHSYTMCKHIVSSLNHITIQKFLTDGWNSKTRNLMERAMISFLERSVSSTAQKIAVDLDEKQLLIFKNYLQNYADLIESQ